MWLCTLDGFFSVIHWHDGRVCVRAREKSSLERLRETHLPELSEIAISPGKDYRYRAFCTHDELKVGMARLADSIDYGNFKDAVLKRQGKSRYESALHTVWSVLGKLQPGGPYSYSRGPGNVYPPIPKDEQELEREAAKTRGLLGDRRW